MDISFDKSLPSALHSTVADILRESGSMSESKNCVFATEQLRGDGSNRMFWRLSCEDQAGYIIVVPDSADEQGLIEAGSVWRIGRHLREKGVPVPRLFGFDESTGILVCEDLGSTHLHQVAATTDFSIPEEADYLSRLYRQAIDSLVLMQHAGAEGFNQDWCWDTPQYDRELMIARESGYFFSAFWQGLLKQDQVEGLHQEFDSLADGAAQAPACFFLHRDFQSRNIMIADGRVRIIDFQGGRLGPRGYDLASLLIDPYAALPPSLQEDLFHYYLKCLQKVDVIDDDEFKRQYVLLALQRNLQILGAFAFLSRVRGKVFFQDFIHPALSSLINMFEEQEYLHLPLLYATAKKADRLLNL